MGGQINNMKGQKSGYAEFPEYHELILLRTLVAWGTYQEYSVRKSGISVLDRRDRIQYRMFEIDTEFFHCSLGNISLIYMCTRIML
jgi:hypothetical protein